MSLEFSCPEGGDFYVCAEGGQFVGCCTADPCGTTGCSAGNLRPAHFPAEQYGTFPDQSCDDGRFYTCGSGFMGCCRSSAVCPNDCSFSDLANIHLSSNEAFAEPFLSLNSTWLATHTTTSESQTTLATMITTTAGSQATNATTTTKTGLLPTSPTPGESTIATAIAPPQDSRLNVGAIVGGAVGGFFVLALLVVAVLWLRQHRCRDKFDASAHSTHDPGPEQRSNAGASKVEKADQETLETHTQGQKHLHGLLESQPSPQSPPPPEYMSNVNSSPQVVHELVGATQWELDSGQRYHPYRSSGQDV